MEYFLLFLAIFGKQTWRRNSNGRGSNFDRDDSVLREECARNYERKKPAAPCGGRGF
jgi:hypothetical protein